MAEALKVRFGPDVAERTGDALAAACRDAGVLFHRDHFVAAATDGFGGLKLGARARLVADAMAG